MYVTYQDLIQIGILIVALVIAATTHNSDGCL